MSRRVIRGGFSPDALRQARLEAGFVQTETARLAKVGTETLRRWESGAASPRWTCSHALSRCWA